MITNSNEKFISYALNLAKKNLGQTAPNPLVGCVIVKNNIIISTGVTAKNGRPHAERIAIDKVTDKKKLEGAEIYVTLEPCVMCAGAIAWAQLGKLVYGAPDTKRGCRVYIDLTHDSDVRYFLPAIYNLMIPFSTSGIV